MPIVVAILNIFLCVFYILFGRLPFLKIEFLHNRTIGLIIITVLFAYITYSALRQYLWGSIAKTRFALQYFLETHMRLLILVLLPIAILYMHAVWGILASWWGNIVFGFSLIYSCSIYYKRFVMYKERGLGEFDFGLNLPNVQARKQKIEYVEIGGIDFGTPRIFLVVQWGLACILRGLVLLILP